MLYVQYLTTDVYYAACDQDNFEVSLEEIHAKSYKFMCAVKS